MKYFKSTYGLGDLVYLITDPDQYERMVTGIKFNLSGVVYTLQHGITESHHYELEITTEKDVLKKITN